MTETFSSPAELRKAQSEVDAFHLFQSLSRELLEVNEKICRARPVEDTLTAQKKNGGGGPLRSPARSRLCSADPVPEQTQGRSIRPRVRRVRHAGIHASGCLGGSDTDPSIRAVTGVAAMPSVFVRPSGSV